ncbi:hypothetical protein [Acinetobacter sp. TUM15071]|uniref:hypothetical protein n=1 Tax=Acinetobacter sp. TUM15071 TaxID=2609135 RepID=UPI00124E13D3|nr:hypothetical protein [Acinetobacter sp. TUM15071]
MYINDVISYMGAWEKLQTDHPKVFDEISLLLKLVKSRIFEMYGDLNEENKWEKPPIGNFIRIEVENSLFDIGWINKSFNIDERAFINNLGVSKDNCFIKAGLSGSNANLSVMSWIFSEITYVSKITDVSIPVLLLFSISANVVKEYLGNKNKLSFKSNKLYSIRSVKKNLERISPLRVEQPFLILGIGLEELELDVVELEQATSMNNEQNIKIDRCITFEPEYYQAGLSILSYFGTVLRDKYPEQNATVRIEQHDLNVRMVIQSENGNIETIEKALHEYELVLKGETSPDEFAISPLKALELKNQLNLVNFQVESQKEIIALQKGQILDLKQIVDKALSPISHPPVTIINQLHNSQSTVINHKAEISKSNDDLEELIDLADSDALKNKLALIQNALDNNRNSDNPEDVKDSNGMKKLAKFLKEANEVGTEANDLAEKGGKAVDLIKSLGRSYNSIAQWCGMPVIPNIFVKE